MAARVLNLGIKAVSRSTTTGSPRPLSMQGSLLTLLQCTRITAEANNGHK